MVSQSGVSARSLSEETESSTAEQAMYKNITMHFGILLCLAHRSSTMLLYLAVRL